MVGMPSLGQVATSSVKQFLQSWHSFIARNGSDQKKTGESFKNYDRNRKTFCVNSQIIDFIAFIDFNQGKS
jgi:hypothetical protein